MANRRRQLSSRISWLARKSPNSIGRILVQMPPGERKSGMPHSVEMPAPVNGTTTFGLGDQVAQAFDAVSRSGAIMMGGTGKDAKKPHDAIQTGVKCRSNRIAKKPSG